MSHFIYFLCTVLLALTSSQVSEHCIDELAPLTPPTYLSLSNSGITPNYSAASSIDYHIPTSTILIAGDFFFINADDDTRSYYHYFQAFTHSNKSNDITLKYSGESLFQNPSHGKFIGNYLRSWSRIIAHPNMPYFYLLGINNLTAYSVDTGKYLWTANIPSCSIYNNIGQPLIYNDATFFPINGIFITLYILIMQFICFMHLHRSRLYLCCWIMYKFNKSNSYCY